MGQQKTTRPQRKRVKPARLQEFEEDDSSLRGGSSSKRRKEDGNERRHRMGEKRKRSTSERRPSRSTRYEENDSQEGSEEEVLSRRISKKNRNPPMSERRKSSNSDFMLSPKAKRAKAAVNYKDDESEEHVEDDYDDAPRQKSSRSGRNSETEKVQIIEKEMSRKVKMTMRRKMIDVQDVLLSKSLAQACRDHHQGLQDHQEVLGRNLSGIKNQRIQRKRAKKKPHAETELLLSQIMQMVMLLLMRIIPVKSLVEDVEAEEECKFLAQDIILDLRDHLDKPQGITIEKRPMRKMMLSL